MSNFELIFADNLIHFCSNRKELQSERSASSSRPRPPPPFMSDIVSIDAHYSRVTSNTCNGPTPPPMQTASLARSTISAAPSFLEEIKALGIDGGKKHLKPVNSHDGGTMKRGHHGKLSVANQSLMCQSPFALTNPSAAKDEDNKKQHGRWNC